MPDNSSQNKQWSNPKDFGLPYVEVTPINPAVENDPISIEKPLEVKESIQEVNSSIEKEEVIDQLQEKKTEKIPVEDKPIESIVLKEKFEEEVLTAIPKAVYSSGKEKKKNNSWVAIVLILAVLIISVIAWQLIGQENNSQSSQVQIVQQETPKTGNTSVQPVVENNPTEETQVTENQDSILNSNSSLEEPVETSQTGTTIDRIGSETLIRVESKSDRPQYFIVVGSLPNEIMAISESEQYLNRASSIYLILPYEDVRNYRLAIGSFASFSKASEELETIKDQYTEALWILKY